MKKKYIQTYKVINGKIIDDNLPNIEELNKIINKYKPPSYLHDIELVAKTIKEADNGIVYIGIDNKDKKQYIYGINFISNRHKNRIMIFLKVNSKIPQIELYIKKQLSIFDKSNYKKKITLDTIFAIILLIELNFFIRTGKKKYLNDNETIGLLTLQKSNFICSSDGIDIIFKSKKQQLQKFYISSKTNSLLYNIIKKLIALSTDETIFKTSNNEIFTESKMYKMISMFNISLKDIRTFGVNRILIFELWKSIENINITDIKKHDIRKIVNSIIVKTANIIGHTPSISKRSYIVDELKSIITPDLINMKYLSFKDFYKYVINKLENTMK